MVNEKQPSIKAHILGLLRQSSDVCSGEALSRSLGVSRVTIWKHIKALQDLGYPIDAGARGYRLEESPDALYPWEFPGRESQVHYFQEIDSTMAAAKKLARAGCPAFTTVIAQRQTGGRGRLDRSWHSDPGGLYMTLVLRPEIPVVDSPRLSFAASLEWVQTLRDLAGVQAVVKWPNDVLCGEHKLAGILSELEADGDLVTFVNIGIGLNVNNDPTAANPGATSLYRLTGKRMRRQALLSAFLDRMERRLTAGGLARAIEDWKILTVTIGRTVRVQTLKETVWGLAEDVDDQGALILRTDSGERRRIVFGDCFHQPFGDS
ncbi:MAG: biotin--[acetyl-CoA-carboxylase] ligase [Desulfobacterales bacterium]|jgi:BirA family biotin operon repressor/biotin-[acetyl-CoA-carboxylase] ligase